MEQIIEPVAPTAADLTAAGLHIIGTLYEPMIDPEAAPIALDGYHINSPYRVEGWDSFLVTPTTPRAMYAGHKTYYYTFTDEAAALTAYGDGITMLPEPVVPDEVSDLQALLAIDAAGMSDAYKAWAESPDRTFAQKAFIERAKVWRRNDPTLLSAATALGLGEAEIDSLFIAAESL